MGWICDYCSTYNVDDDDTCIVCGTAKPAERKAKETLRTLTKKNVSDFSLTFGDVVIPDGYSSIGVRAFEKTEITGVTLPAQVKKIGKYAFRNCRNLRRVTCSHELLSIEEGAFLNCPSLTPENRPSARRIDPTAFDDLSESRSASTSSYPFVGSSTSSVEPASAEGVWICASCGTCNVASDRTCIVCDSPRGETPIVDVCDRRDTESREAEARARAEEEARARAEAEARARAREEERREREAAEAREIEAGISPETSTEDSSDDDIPASDDAFTRRIKKSRLVASIEGIFFAIVIMVELIVLGKWLNRVNIVYNEAYLKLLAVASCLFVLFTITSFSKISRAIFYVFNTGFIIANFAIWITDMSVYGIFIIIGSIVEMMASIMICAVSYICPPKPGESSHVVSKTIITLVFMAEGLIWVIPESYRGLFSLDFFYNRAIYWLIFCAATIVLLINMLFVIRCYLKRRRWMS